MDYNKYFYKCYPGILGYLIVALIASLSVIVYSIVINRPLFSGFIIYLLFFMHLFMFIISRIYYKKHLKVITELNYSLTYDNVNVVQERAITMNVNLKEAFNKCQNFMLNFKNRKYFESDSTTGVLKLKVQNARRVGQDMVEIHLSEVDPETTSVKILSKPVSSYDHFDMGRNLVRADEIVKALSQA